jgi:acetyl esterase/lipase
MADRPPQGASLSLEYRRYALTCLRTQASVTHAALTKAGVPSSFVRIAGTGHGFEGPYLERATAPMVQWFEQRLGSTAK